MTNKKTMKYDTNGHPLDPNKLYIKPKDSGPDGPYLEVKGETAVNIKDLIKQVNSGFTLDNTQTNNNG